MRESSALAVSALRRWQQVRTTHQNAQVFAVHYHDTQLRYKMLLNWRLQLRAKLKLAKQGRALEKFFVMRHALHRWQEKVAQAKRERKLKEFETKLAAKYFHGQSTCCCRLDLN